MTVSRHVLEAKQEELLTGLRNREGIVIMPAAEELDGVQHAVSKLNLDSALLRAVRAALRRVDEGR